MTWKRSFRGDGTSFLPSRRALEVLEGPEVAKMLSAPSPLPIELRRHMAVIMAADLLGEHPQICPEDTASLVLMALMGTRAWRDAGDMVHERPDLLSEVLLKVLPQVMRAAEDGMAGLELGEVPLDDWLRALALLEGLLGPPAESWHEAGMTAEQKRALSLLLRLLTRELDRSIAFLIEMLRRDAELLSVLDSMLPGQGWDLHRVQLHRTALENLGSYSEMLDGHKDIKRLEEMLGKTSGTREGRTLNAAESCSETHSLRFSGDLQRMLPQEMVNLADDRLALLFFARMCERRLLTYQLRGRNYADGERKRGGPVVALLDSSGSMSGEPELAAKALLLTLSKRLREDHRPLRALMFSVDVHSFDLSGRATNSQFLDFLCHSFGGGTDFDAALRKGMECLEDPTWRGADILFITDGLARIKDRGCLHDWNCLKERQGARIFTVIVGGTEPGGLQRISDRVFLMGRKGQWADGSILQDFTPQPRSIGSCWVTQ